jgi:uncharacterized membrane protein YraQ (UPF0718 family)
MKNIFYIIFTILCLALLGLLFNSYYDYQKVSAENARLEISLKTMVEKIDNQQEKNQELRNEYQSLLKEKENGKIEDTQN